ncbi:hypothetical protein THICB3320284 [Thiomonas sp. CB3]|nr:hypothetical protein THICB3320284 [Thiomonas sp. CB3]
MPSWSWPAGCASTPGPAPRGCCSAAACATSLWQVWLGRYEKPGKKIPGRMMIIGPGKNPPKEEVEETIGASNSTHDAILEDAYVSCIAHLCIMVLLNKYSLILCVSH